MSKLVLYLLLPLYLLTALTPEGWLLEFSKLPDLISHFQYHQSIQSELTFFDFLSQHYGAQTHQGAHSHEKLPFKAEHHHCAQCCGSLNVICFKNIEYPFFQSEPNADDYQLPSFEQQGYSLLSVTDIFQPPKSIAG